MHHYTQDFRVTIQILNIQEFNQSQTDEKLNKYSLQIRIGEQLLIFSKEDLDVDYNKSRVEKSGKFSANYNEKTAKYEFKGSLKVYQQSKHTKFDTILGISSLSSDALLNQLYSNKNCQSSSYQLQKAMEKVNIKILFRIQKINNKDEKQQPTSVNYEQIQIKETLSIKSQESSINKSSPIKELPQNQYQTEIEEFENTSEKAKVVQSMNLQDDKKFLKHRKQRAAAARNNVSTQQVVDPGKFYQDQIKTLGQQLIVERRKIIQNQNKHLAMKQKYQKLKKKWIQTNNQNKDLRVGVQQISQLIQKCKIIVDSQKKIIILEYSDEAFVQSIQNKTSMLLNNEKSTSNISDNKSEILLMNEQLQEQKNKLQKENLSLKENNLSLNKKFHEQKQKLLQFETRITQLTEEIYFIEAKNRSMVGEIEELQQLLGKNRERVLNLEQQLTEKQHNLQTLTRRSWKQKEEINNLQKMNEDLKSKNKNYKLEIDEKSQEIENLNEIIDKYKKKYGEMKHSRNKDLEFEIKDCLRWIEKQSFTTEGQVIQPTANSEDEFSIETELNSVFNSLQINDIPASKLGSVRNELVKVLQKLDNLMEQSQQTALS